MQLIFDETEDPHPAGINPPFAAPRERSNGAFGPRGPDCQRQVRLLEIGGDEEVRYWPNEE